MQVLVLIVALVCGTRQASAASAGDVALCDAAGNFGCNSWQNGDRLQRCLDPNPGEMPWVRRPSKTGIYTVRTGDSSDSGNDPTTYVPGSTMTIYITVTQERRKYRGLLLHAVDSNGNSVGDWNSPLADNPLFWVPPKCPKAVLHVDAEEKPYEVQIQFTAPPAGTGTITLKSLFKEGPANTGEFWYPSQDPVLTEAAPFSTNADAPIWVMSNPGQSCDATCGGLQRSCDLGKLKAVDSAAKLSAVLAETQRLKSPCTTPMMATCDTRGKGPVQTPDGKCFFNSPVCYGGKPSPAVSCGAAGGAPYTNRFCACTKRGAKAPPAKPTPRYTGSYENSRYQVKNDYHYAVVTQTGPGQFKWTVRAGVSWTLTATPGNPALLQVGTDCTYYASGYTTAAVTFDANMVATRIAGPGNEPFDRTGNRRRRLLAPQPPPTTPAVQSAATSAAPARSSPVALPWVVAAAACASLGGTGGRAPLLLLAALCALALLQQLPGARAHNWMTSPARSAHIAQGLMPCPGRGPTDTHTQVGPGQDFIIKWSSSHEPNMIHVALVAEADLGRLSNRDSKKWLDEYIDSAPGGSNIAQQARFKRAWDGPAGQATGGGNVLSRVVPPSDPVYMNIPSEPTRTMYAYADSRIAGDRQVYYRSAKYPWIVGAGRFQLLQGRPDDSDMIRMRVPDSAPVGHYVANWRFQGYYDCVDIDKMAAPVQNVYGVASGQFQYDRVDHCQFPGARNITAPCTLSPDGNLATTLDYLTRNYPPDAADNIHGHVSNDLRVLGYSMVRANPHPLAKFPNRARNGAIPIKDPVCLASGAMNMGGTDSSSAKPWAAWRAGDRTTTVQGRRCANGPEVFTTLDDAVTACTESTCTGLSWLRQQAAADAVFNDARYRFRLCTSDPTAVTDGQWTSFVKKPRNLVPRANGPYVLSFNFAPAGQGVTDLTPGMTTDTGGPYSAKNGKVYGWTTNCGAPPMERVPNQPGGDLKENFGVKFLDYCNGPAPPMGPTLDRQWEVSVPNGVWDVEVVTSAANRGCYIENTRLNNQGGDLGAGSRVKTTVRVGVTDNKLTLGGMMDPGSSIPQLDTLGSGCWYVSTLVASHIGDALPTAWMPPSTNPWWQRDLGTAKSIGIVQITPPDGFKTTCRQRWLYGGISCNDAIPAKYANNPAFTQGEFDAMKNRNDVGLTVRVSDTPCSGSGTCPGQVCGTVTEVVLTEASRPQHHLAPISVDCNGKSGRYVTVQLPGQQRIFAAATITVNGQTPEEVDLPRDMHVGFGVEARPPTSTASAFEVSLDPLDPTFYSTCFIRRKKVTFLPVAPPKPPQERFRFNLNCLDCRSFAAATQIINTNPASKAPVWKMSNTCFDCSNVNLAGASTLSAGGLAVGTAIAIAGSAVAFIALLVVAVFITRRLRSSASGMQAVPKSTPDWATTEMTNA